MRDKEIIADYTSGYFYKYSGNASEVHLISDTANPLITIGSKAFLSCKNVERLYLPPTLERVEDWAFAHMKNLCEITLPAREIHFGRKVFLGCEKLSRVHLAPVYEGMSYFLASMFRFFPDNSLDNLKMAGDEQGQWQWLACYDGALQNYICRADDYDFEPAFIGWFDIEDVDDQKQHFVLQQKKHKIRLAFQRLLYGERLATESADFLQEYLLKECRLVEEVLLDEDEPCSSDVRYFRKWRQIGGLNQGNVEHFLERVSEANPEIRGYLLKIKLENMEKINFFDSLDL